MFGYAGSIAEIDLSEGKIRIKNTDERGEKFLREYLGGIGFNTRWLWEETDSTTDPLSPQNCLVFSIGVFGCTNLPTSSRTEASGRSPATGLFGTSSSGNYWGSELKFAGFDSLVIKGRAASPVYLWITNDGIEIRPAEHLWGRDARETMEILRRELGDDQAQVAAVGPGGENRVRFGCIENGPYGAWARTGLGAVMGSKNLKAIAVRGRGGIRAADKKAFLNLVKEAREKLLKSPFYEPFKRFGTMNATVPYAEFGALPGRNFQTGVLTDWEDTRTRKLVHKYSQRGIACISCPIACGHWTEVKEGPFAGLCAKDLEVTPVMAFGATCDVPSLPAVAYLTEVCQSLGIDAVSAAGAAAFAMELFQRGILKEKEIGFPLVWGDVAAIEKLLRMIAYRQGIGDILAEGVYRASQVIPGAADYAMHVKGLELPMADPRGRWSTWTFGYLTNIRGGDHLRCRNPVENLRFNENPKPYRTERFGFPETVYQELDMPEEEKAKIFDPDTRDVNIPRMSKWAEDLISVFNATGVCIRPPVLQAWGPALLSRLYTALTGIEISAQELMQAGERIWNLQKLFNLRAGERPEDSSYPRRFYEEPLPEGPAKGKKLDAEAVREALQEYYAARGWDEDTGVPRAEKLRSLGLKED